MRHCINKSSLFQKRRKLNWIKIRRSICDIQKGHILGQCLWVSYISSHCPLFEKSCYNLLVGYPRGVTVELGTRLIITQIQLRHSAMWRAIKKTSLFYFQGQIYSCNKERRINRPNRFLHINYVWLFLWKKCFIDQDSQEKMHKVVLSASRLR